LLKNAAKKNLSLIGGNLGAAYFIVLLITGVLYVATCAPGPLWQDSGMYQYRIRHHDIEGKLGLALSHPLYHIIGIGAGYIPLGDFAHRINLISAIAGALAIANLFLLLALWLGRFLPAVVGAVTLALSHTFWRHAVIAEDYCLYAALLLAELIMLLQYVRSERVRYLYLLGLFNGLAVATHMFASIALLCYAGFCVSLLVKSQIRIKHIAIILGLWLLGATPYLYLVIKTVIHTGDVGATIASALFGRRWQADVLNVRLSVSLVKENLLLIAYNFPTANILLFFAGLYELKRKAPTPAFRWVVTALLAGFFVFAFRYTVPDHYAFFIPFYCMVAVILGLGAGMLTAQRHKALWAVVVLSLSVLPIPAYMIGPCLAKKLSSAPAMKRQIPFRNDYKWFLQPWKNSDHSPQKFADAAFETAEKNAVIYADGTTVYPLLYAQEVQKKRPDVRIVSSHPNRSNPVVLDEQSLSQLLKESCVYVVTPAPGYCPAFLLQQYEFRQAGVLWKVVD